MKDRDYQMVEYSNKFSTATTGFNAYELDVFLILIYLARQKFSNAPVNPDEELVIDLSLKELKNILRINGNPSHQRIEAAVKNIFNATFFFKDKSNTFIEHRHLFERLQIYIEKDMLNLTIRKEYVNLFFNLTGNFTQHSIITFNSLKGRYAKRLYQIIMAYKKLRNFQADVDIFRTMLEIPRGYRWADIEKVFNPAKKEIEEKTEIKEFEIVKIKEGRKITKIELKWTFKDDEPEKIEEAKEEKEPEILLSEKEDDKIKALTQEEEEMLEWIFENTTIKRLPGKKGTELYIKMARGIINNFQNGEVKIND